MGQLTSLGPGIIGGVVAKDCVKYVGIFSSYKIENMVHYKGECTVSIYRRHKQNSEQWIPSKQISEKEEMQQMTTEN